MTTTQRRALVTYWLGRYPTSARRACGLIGLSRSRWHHQPRRPARPELRERLKALAGQRQRRGYQRLHYLLRREGWIVNHKLILRLYREEGLAIARRRGKKRVAVPRVPLPAPSGATERWSMDFVSDALADGRPFRCFTLVDDFTRECPAIEVSHSLPALRAIQVLERLAAVRGLTRSIVCDNGPEFARQALDRWVHERGVALQFIRPGKPIENAFIESFNGKFRDECLSVNWVTTLRDAQQSIEAWRHDYNTIRPHKGLHSNPPISSPPAATQNPPPVATPNSSTSG